ncbi:succinate dehydrogenase cytochrome b subunit [Verrucomicrobium sp. BvORR106]|uniref:succinate dehydrogenase cytochrome b subunit n=1 Tax=Verrucomicrobium sp. BvORR106 TaxID=1403819 RepID=UPI00056FEEAF|nr:succinate dehydrogenase cytochrome b subunit [Verrucomicrobium sp. BvORR106]
MSALTKSLSAFICSSIGKKFLVALTGAALVIFILGHMVGNLLIFLGPDALNAYGHKLQSMGALLWVARIGLLVTVAIHIIFTIKLTRENRVARTSRYGYQATIQASKSSRYMIFSGLTVLAFIVYHILHFTLHVGNNYGELHTNLHGETVHDVYTMVIHGFSWKPASIFYIFAMGLLCSHLSHGVSSMFQTLGLATARSWPVFKALGLAYAAFIFIGNCSIPLAVMLGWVK